MDIATLIGLVLAWGAFLGSILIEGGELSALLNPSAALLVFGSTLGASMICFPLSTVTGLPGIVKNAFMAKKEDVGHLIKTLVGYAEKARREGLLALEDEVQKMDDPFLKKASSLLLTAPTRSWSARSWKPTFSFSGRGTMKARICSARWAASRRRWG